MHPLMTAWFELNAHCDRQPQVPSPAFGVWLAEAERLSMWFNTLRRLPQEWD